jgi:hypothetical protein
MWPDAARQLNLDHRLLLVAHLPHRSQSCPISAQHSGIRRESVRAAKRTHGLRVLSSMLTRGDWYLDSDTSKGPRHGERVEKLGGLFSYSLPRLMWVNKYSGSDADLQTAPLAGRMQGRSGTATPRPSAMWEKPNQGS